MQNFGYTLQIPAGCLINTFRYRDYDACAQQNLLRSLLNKFVIGHYTVFFEKHKDRRLHCHGIIKDTDRKQMEYTQQIINKELNYRKDMTKIFKFDYLVTPYDEANWNRYCQKEQGVVEPERTAPQISPADRSKKFLMEVTIKE